MKRIYLDAVSTTAPDAEVLATYQKLLQQHYANSDALYDEGVALFRLQEESRRQIGKLLSVYPEEVIFTSGASEANNTAIKGVAWAHPERKHLITSIYEHSSVYGAMQQLQRLGWEVTYLYPNAQGQITPDAVKAALREDTALVSIMAVNNELGSINDVDAIQEVVKKESNAYFHCDMTQAIAKIFLPVNHFDLASFSAHKIHGLKGSGVLIKKKHVRLEALISGGQQEFSLRGGTSNAASNIVLAKTLRLALQRQEKENSHTAHLADYCRSLLQEIPGVSINSPAAGISNLLNITTPIKSEVLLNAMNQKGIMISSRSTCGSRKNEPSRVLHSMGFDEERAIRISFDMATSEADIAYFAEVLKESIEKYG